MNEPSRNQQYRYSAKSGEATNAPFSSWLRNMDATLERIVALVLFPLTWPVA
jgi:hypothetical protein